MNRVLIRRARDQDKGDLESLDYCRNPFISSPTSNSVPRICGVVRLSVYKVVSMIAVKKALMTFRKEFPY